MLPPSPGAAGVFSPSMLFWFYSLLNAHMMIAVIVSPGWKTDKSVNIIVLTAEIENSKLYCLSATGLNMFIVGDFFHFESSVQLVIMFR